MGEQKARQAEGTMPDWKECHKGTRGVEPRQTIERGAQGIRDRGRAAIRHKYERPELSSRPFGSTQRALSSITSIWGGCMH